MAEEKCTDKKCYRHAGVKVRGGTVTGKIVSAKGKNTVVVERASTQFFSKYQRWAKRRTHVAAHKPGCMKAGVGDIVTIGETRKLSKTKAWTVIGVVEPVKRG